ncbi:MAG: Uncharacterized protein XD52_0501, partial [bacterium 42_11]
EIKFAITKAVQGEITQTEAEQKLKHVTLTEKRTEDEIIVETLVPSFIVKSDLKFTVDLDILAPPYVNLAIDTGLQKLNGSRKEGSIEISYKERFTTEISNMKGNLNIFSGPANIEIKNFEGKITAHSLSGTVKLKNCAGELYIQDESGNIYLNECSGYINLKTRSGNVFISDVEALNLNITASSGNIKAEFTPLSDGNYHLATSSGWAKLKIPFHSSCYIKFETICGKIFSEQPFEVGEETILKLGNGEGNLVIKTGSGDIYLLHGFMEED